METKYWIVIALVVVLLLVLYKNQENNIYNLDNATGCTRDSDCQHGKKCVPGYYICL